MKLSYLAIPAALVAGSAHAGGYVPPVVEPAPVAVVAAPVADLSDWTGFYAGLQYGQGNAELSDDSLDSDFDAYGLHGGYLHDFGKVVVGGELDYNQIEIDDADEDGDLTRLRGRAGYDLGRFLPYATLGVANLDAGDVSETAATYGIGADFKVTERFTLGAEYSKQDFDDVSDIDDLDLDTDMVQLRGSIRF